MSTPVLDLDANDSSGASGTGYVTTFTENGPPVPEPNLARLITPDCYATPANSNPQQLPVRCWRDLSLAEANRRKYNPRMGWQYH